MQLLSQFYLLIIHALTNDHAQVGQMTNTTKCNCKHNYGVRTYAHALTNAYVQVGQSLAQTNGHQAVRRWRVLSPTVSSREHSTHTVPLGEENNN